VNDAYLTLIYQLLGHAGLRTPASNALANIVSKKMNPTDKLELIIFLNLTQVVNSLNANEDDDFSESMARLVNVQGLELTRILIEGGPPDQRTKALGALRDLFPLLLRFLADEYDETSMAVFPFLTELLMQSRRAKRNTLDILDRDFLQALLNAIFKKMRYDDESSYPLDNDSGEEADFQDLRKQLLGFQYSIGSIDPDLYSSCIHKLIGETLQALSSGSIKNWRDIEAALYEMHTFSEPLKGISLLNVADLVNGNWENTRHFELFTELFTELVTLGTCRS
jgi:exportin-T